MAVFNHRVLMLDRKCQNMVLKRKVGQEPAWDLCLNTSTPTTKHLKNPLPGFPSNIKAACSHSQTRVRILGDIPSQQVPEHNSCCCCYLPALKLPWGGCARAGLGSSRISFCISAKVVLAEMRRDNEKG